MLAPQRRTGAGMTGMTGMTGITVSGGATGASGIFGDLMAQPHRYEFFQAVRLLQQAGAGQRLRYRNRLSLGFPPNQIENITEEGGERIRVTPAFMGLLGSQGVLPLHYSEGINRYEKANNDGGPRAFLDLLSHRATELFYEAWAMHQPESMAASTTGSTTAADTDDGFMAILLALAGVSSRDGVHRATVARYAAHIRSRNVSAPLLAGMYSEYFDTGFVVEQLVGHWQPLDRAHQARLGRAHVDLGSGVLLGARIYSCNARVRLRIGPLDRSAWEGNPPHF